MGAVSQAATAFSLGLATPLSAVCVLPLYPGFLAFLSTQDEDAPSVAVLGALVAVGVIACMAGVGLVFTTALGRSLTGLVGTVSPVIFALLAVFGLLLVVGRRPHARLPRARPPQTSNPSLSAFGYGVFFGAVVLPCNPGFVAVFFARAVLFVDPVTSLASFGGFVIGMATPLLALALVSEHWRDRVLGALTRHRRAVDVATGVVMVAVALYYLFGVFTVHESLG